MNLIIWPNKILNEPSIGVDYLNCDYKVLSKEMFEVMYANKGVGLSAIQVGVPLRLFVMDCSGGVNNFKDNIDPKPMVCLDPVIIEFIGKQVELTEGCLSFPGIYEQVKRYPEIIFECKDLMGETKTWQVAGIEAQCVQHEIEHLEGKTMGDNWGRVKKDIVKRKINKTLNGR